MRYPDTTDGRHKWRRDIESFLRPHAGASTRLQLSQELEKIGFRSAWILLFSCVPRLLFRRPSLAEKYGPSNSPML
jgi:hypothetical protein